MIDGYVADGYVPGAEVHPAAAAADETTPPADPESAGGGAHDGDAGDQGEYPDDTEGGYDTPPEPDDPGEVGIEALFAPSADAAPGSYPDAEDVADGGPGEPPGLAGPDTALAGSALAGSALADGAVADGAGDERLGEWNQPVVTPVDQSGPPRRQHLRDLAVDSRMRIWRRRLLITVISGTIFAIIFTWRLGLTVAALVAIADTVYRSRTMASIPPGIKVTHAQRRTQRLLARLERSGYRSLHSRPIPGSKEFIDHLVVGPAGVFAIDSERWDRRLPVRTRNARELWVGPDSKEARLEHARWEAERAQTLISGNLGREVVVRPAMAVYGPRVPWDVVTIRDVDVFKGRRLRRYMRKRIRVNGNRTQVKDVDDIHQAAAQVLPL